MGFLDPSPDSRLTFGGDDNGEGGLTLSGEARRKATSMSTQAFYIMLGALCLWIFAYGSGLYPYLGAGHDDNRSSPGTSTSMGAYSFGLGTMLLFEGQTAFFEYNSTSVESDVTLDVKPLTVLGYSDRMQRVRGLAKGTVEFPITQTGLYHFDHEPALGRRYGQTRYSVSWGAR